MTTVVQADNDTRKDTLGLPSDTEPSSLSSVLKKLQPTDEAESESTASETFAERQPPEGSECAIQTLYEGPPKCQCCKNWVEEYSDDLRRTVEEQDETKQKALVKRMRKNHGDGKALVLDSIVVQSVSLKKTLSEVFEGYKGITASLNKVVFKSPFHPFYYRWGRFTEIVERQKHDDPTSALYSVLLYDELKKELSDVMTEIDDHIHHGVITYQLLWALFEPGMRIVATEGNQARFYIVESCKYNFEKFHLAINARFVDWDGESFGYSDEKIKIYDYTGTKPIASLSAFPAELHPLKGEAQAKAISRGQRFRDLQGFQYMAYSGLVWYKIYGRELERNVRMPLVKKFEPLLTTEQCEDRWTYSR